MWAKYVAEARKKIMSVSDMHLPMMSLYLKLMQTYPRADYDLSLCLGDFAEPASPDGFLELFSLLKDYFDAILPGNHEFYARNKTFGLLQRDQSLFESIPFIGLNYFYRGRPRFESHRIVGDTALIGLCNYNATELGLIDQDTNILTVEESIKKAKLLADSLHHKADFFVFLTHYTHKQGLDIAQWIQDNTSLFSDQFVVLSAHDHAVYPKEPLLDPLLPVVDAGSHFRGVGITHLARPGCDWKIRTSVEPFYEPTVLLPWCYERVNHVKKFQDYFHVAPLAGKLIDLLKKELAVDVVLKNAGTDRWSFTDDQDVDPYTNSAEFSIAMYPFPEGLYVAELTKEQIRSVLQADADLLPGKSVLEDSDFQCKNHLHPSGLSYTVIFDEVQQKYVVSEMLLDEKKEKYRVAITIGVVSILGLENIFNFKTIQRENTYLDCAVMETVLPAKNAKDLKNCLVQAGMITDDNKLLPKYVYRYKTSREMISELKLEYLDLNTQELLWSMYAHPIFPPLRVFIQKWLNERRLTPEYKEEDYAARKRIITREG